MLTPTINSLVFTVFNMLTLLQSSLLIFDYFFSGEDLVPESTSQGAETDEEARRTAAEGETGECAVPHSHGDFHASHAPSCVFLPAHDQREAPDDGRQAGFGA